MGGFYAGSTKMAALMLVCFSSLVIAQDYVPFDAQVTKRFYNNADPADDSYYFYAESSQSPAPGVIEFKQYRSIQTSTWEPDISDCNAWGGPTLIIADTNWLGLTVQYDSNTRHLVLKNELGETLDFDFSLNPGDSAIFYQNTTDKYYIRAEPVTYDLIYTVQDSVKPFTILHYDQSNQPVNSSLHQETISLGKETGLIAFIDIYNFPASEKLLLLKGQLNPLIGTYQMRYEDLYPFQAGDTLQYRGRKSTPTAGYSCEYYSTYTVTSRTETSDSVTLTFVRSDFFIDSWPPLSSGYCGTIAAYPSTFTFPKNSDLLNYPYNRIFPGQTLPGSQLNQEINATTLCGPEPSIEIKNIVATYCDSCQCLVSIDGYQQDFPTRNFTLGLGMQLYSAFTPSPESSFQELQLVYSKIGGVECGTMAWQGVGEAALNSIQLYPNPVREELRLSTPVEHILIYSSDSRLVETVNNPGLVIDVSHLPAGLYFFQLQHQGSSSHQRIVKY